jgi:ribosomal 30S subunit maturation factor RimM
VFYQDSKIGKLTDAMINRMQSVFIIELEDGRELLVPNVSQYVSAIDKQSQIVYLQNLEELLEVCTSM